MPLIFIQFESHFITLKLLREFLGENIQFYIFVESKQGKNALEIHKKFTVALGDKAPSLPTVYRWMESNIGERESFRDRHRAGRPVTAVNEQNAEQVKKILAEDARATLFELIRVMRNT